MSLPLWRKVNSVVPPDSVASGVASEVAGADAGAATGTEAGEDAAGPPRTHVSLATALRIPGVVLVIIAFFAYCALESTVILWAATYLVGDRGVDAATAAAFASLFLIGITGGRFLAGFFADRVGDRALIRGGFVMVGVGVVMLALPLGTVVVALAGLVVAGLGCAAIYPAIIHSTPANFGRRNSQAIIGIQMASAYGGSTLAPPLFGALSAWFGLWILPLLLAVLVALGLVISERLGRVVDAAR